MSRTEKQMWLFLFLFMLTLAALTVVVFTESQQMRAMQEWYESRACAICFKMFGGD